MRFLKLFSGWTGKTLRDMSPNPKRLKGSDRNKYQPHLNPSAAAAAERHNAALRAQRESK